MLQSELQSEPKQVKGANLKPSKKRMYSDENITQFLAFTGSSDTDAARSYLEMSGGSVETAVGLWLEHNGGGGGGGGGGAIGGGAMGGEDGAMGGGGGGGGGGFQDADAIRAPDRTRTEALIGPAGGHGAMAAAMAAGGMFAAGAGSISGAEAAMMSAFAAASDDDDDYDDDDGMVHVGGGGSGSGSGSASAATAFDAREAVNQAAAAAAASGGGDNNDENAPSGGPTSNGDGPVGAAAGGRATSLADMFAPPTDLIYAGPGGFQGARQAAKDSRRWLLVNIQSDSDFACHALNRDVWRDELVENLVRDGFIFWQAVDTTSEGSTYSERYRVGGYPHVAIIDPRTARLMWKKEGWTQVNPMTPVQFAETAADFCSRHSFDKPPSAPRSGSAAPAPASGGRPSNKRPMADMSEEEQLEAAIRASMADAEGGASGGRSDGDDADEDGASVVYVDDVDEEAVGDDDMDAEDQKKPAAADANAPVVEEDEVASETFEQELLDQDIGEEPTSGDGIARVQIRMPDGKRLVRKFRGEDSVKVIYAFVAQHSSDAIRGGNQLELKAGFPPRDLLDKIDESISSCGLAGEAITARCK